MMSLLLLPMLACIALVFVHVYFGAFVLRRGVIFVDLALAQWASFGYITAHLLDIHDTPSRFMMGFAFTLIAAFILTILKPLYDKVNLQEAVIGVVYIIATAAATGIISSSGMEGSHLKDMLAGHLLFIQPAELISAIVLYSLIGAALFFLHSHFLSSNSRIWDFIFYALFGVVVTSSVKMVGILLVFSYLVLPILSIVLYTDSLKTQLTSGWIIGIISSFIGLGLSLVLDVPPSYCVILVLCSVWIITTVLKQINIS